MGNQISAATRKKGGAPSHKEIAPGSSKPEDLSQQGILTSRPTLRKRLSTLKLAVPSQTATPSPPSSPSLRSSGSVTLHKQSTDTDGASSPRNEKFDITLPAPSMMTDTHYLSLSLDAASPSEASTITQAIFESPNVFGIADLAASSLLPNPVPSAREDHSTFLAASSPYLLSVPSKDALFAERAAPGPVHDLWG
ncbi:MAG: hypothetical protein L6R40_004932 [Gallowayella cf. fulva]|nr:MAG: hypothetical protein L6R40_004932 [Xanthomendoza cf. fulva]